MRKTYSCEFCSIALVLCFYTPLESRKEIPCGLCVSRQISTLYRRNPVLIAQLVNETQSTQEMNMLNQAVEVTSTGIQCTVSLEANVILPTFASDMGLRLKIMRLSILKGKGIVDCWTFMN